MSELVNNGANEMEDEFQEYITFSVTSADGKEVEMAVVDEFEFEHKNYVVASIVEDDTINEDEVYIYRVVAGEEFQVEKIESEDEYGKIANAYMEL